MRDNGRHLDMTAKNFQVTFETFLQALHHIEHKPEFVAFHEQLWRLGMGEMDAAMWVFFKHMDKYLTFFYFFLAISP